MFKCGQKVIHDNERQLLQRNHIRLMSRASETEPERERSVIARVHTGFNRMCVRAGTKKQEETRGVHTLLSTGVFHDDFKFCKQCSLMTLQFFNT